MLKLTASGVQEAVVQRWEGGERASSIALRGAWKIGIAPERDRRVSSFPLRNGGVLLGEREGEAHLAALFEMPREPVKIRTLRSSLTVRGTADDHLLRIEARNGALKAFEARGAMTKVATPVTGADFSQLEFADQELVVRAGAFDGAGRPPAAAACYDLQRASRFSSPLEKAKLTVIRAHDLVNVTFQFHGFEIVEKLFVSRIEPIFRDAILLDALQNESADRPVLVAQLPPQHILEAAYLYQSPSPKDWPNVSLDPWPPLAPDGTEFTTREDIEGYKECLDADYAAFRNAYFAQFNTKYYPPDPPLPSTFSPEPPPDRDNVNAILNARAVKEPLGDVVEAHIARPTRLAFTFALDPNNPGQLPARRKFKIDFDDLLRWDDLELVVARNASLYDAFLQKKPDRPRVGNNFGDQRIAGLLAYHGISPVAGLPDDALKARMAQVVAAIVPPDDFVTSIEIPARLSLSPSQSARFETSSFDYDRAQQSGRLPVWSARLTVEDGVSGDLRAIYSPDFDKATYFRGIDGTPTDHPTSKNVPPWKEAVQDRHLRLALNKRDRHELVSLTSLYGLPVLPRLPATTVPDDPTSMRPPPSTVPPPDGFALQIFCDADQGVYLPPPLKALEARALHRARRVDRSPGRLRTARLALHARPQAPRRLSGAGHRRLQPAHGHRLRPSGRGPVQGLPVSPRPPRLAGEETERFTLDGPTPGEPPIAYLVQHLFLRLPPKERTYPQVGHPYQARDLPFGSTKLRGGRSPDLVDPNDDTVPAPSVGANVGANGRIALSDAGLGLVFWPRTAGDAGSNVHFRFSYDGKAQTLSAPLIFVDNTAAHDQRTMLALVNYYSALNPALRTAIAGGAPLRFSPEHQTGGATFETDRIVLEARGRGDVLGNQDGSPVPAQFAMTPYMEGADQPPFYPWMREGHIRVRSLQRFLDQPKGTIRVSYHPNYRDHGFEPGANPAELYLSVHGQLNKAPMDWYEANPAPVMMNMSGRGERAGGFANPAVLYTAISNIKGPVGGGPQPPPSLTPASFATSLIGADSIPFATTSSSPSPDSSSGSAAESGLFNPTDFFHTDAKLLGLLPLRDVLKAALFAAAPKLVEEMGAINSAVADATAEALQELNDIVAALNGWAADAIPGLRSVVFAIDAALNTTLAGVTVAELYPALTLAARGLDSASGAMAQAIDSASADSGNPIEALGNLASAASVLNVAIATLGRELEQLASHPIPRPLVEFVTSLKAGLDALQKLNPSDFLFATIGGALLGPANDVLTDDENYAAWRALLFGPDNAKPLNTIEWSDTQKREALFAKMGQALAFEAVGRPIVDAFHQCQALAAASGSLTSLQRKTITTANSTFLAIEAAAQAPVLLDALGAPQDACSALVKMVSDIVDAGSDGAGGGILAANSAIEDTIVTIESNLQNLADTETKAQAMLDKAAANVPNPAPDAALNALDDLKQTVTRVSQLRRTAAAGIDRIKTDLALLDTERKALPARIAAGCTTRIFAWTCWRA